MHDKLPIYCETALNALGSFPFEPVNAATSFFPVLMGVLALYYLRRNRTGGAAAYSLAVLTILTGLGSVAWHAMRTELTLLIDALPGVAYFVVVTVVWLYHIGARYYAVLFVMGFVALMLLVSPADREAQRGIIIGVLGLVAAAMVVATWYRKRPAFKFAFLMVGSAAAAATFRMLDLHSCDMIAVGTHFFWHILLGVAAYAGVRMVVMFKEPETADVRTA